ncbi:MAG: 50S ribosomal protein L10 [Nanoarchaeota archaeon]
MEQNNSAQKYVTQPAKKKIEAVSTFVKLIKEYPIIGVVNMQNLPARQLASMRKQLRGTVLIQMTKKSLLHRTLETIGGDYAKLIPYFKGMPALLFSKENPFKLFKILKKNKSKAPIKAGQQAPNDIIIPAGPTPFAPGPIIGELSQNKIAAGVEGGKVAIKKDSLVAKEGDIISPGLSSILLRLGLQPMEIGLDLVAVYEKGEIMTKDVLDIDETVFMKQIQTACSEGINLAVYAGYTVKDTIELLVAKAVREARALSISEDILTSDTTGDILAKAEREMNALKANIPN